MRLSRGISIGSSTISVADRLPLGLQTSRAQGLTPHLRPAAALIAQPSVYKQSPGGVLLSAARMPSCAAGAALAEMRAAEESGNPGRCVDGWKSRPSSRLAGELELCQHAAPGGRDLQGSSWGRSYASPAVWAWDDSYVPRPSSVEARALVGPPRQQEDCNPV